MCSAVCWRCIEDVHLQKAILEQGRPAQCSRCKKNSDNAFSAVDLAKLLDPILVQFIDPLSGGDRQEGYGEPLSYYVQKVINQDLGFEDEIVRALIDNEDFRPQHGGEAFFDAAQDYATLTANIESLSAEWDSALDDLKYRRRFFSSAAAALFQKLFHEVETRQWWNAEKREAESVVRNLPEASDVFRARICASPTVIGDAYRDPLKYVGPPPLGQARAGRMNIEGIAVFYGAIELDTCLAEVRPALANDVAVIVLRTTRSLRLLDFTRLDDSFRNWSYFQPDFAERRRQDEFLRHLQDLIAQPITPGQETSYLITQTMAEYLAHMHERPFDGILFKSVQHSCGTNIVLFPNADNTFPLTYLDKSLMLFSTTSVQYKHKRVHFDIINDNVVFFPWEDGA